MGKQTATGTWSEQEVQQLKKLAKQNTPTPLLASKLNRTEHSIRYKARAEGISLRPTNRSPYG